MTRIEEEVAREVGAAVDFAEGGTWEPLDQLETFVLMDKVPA
jgi:hypothetical protein